MTNLNDTPAGGPLRAADFAQRAVLLRCTADACGQGRLPCPCPQACLVATDDTRADEGAGAVVWGVIALIVGMACVSAFGDTLMALAREVVR